MRRTNIGVVILAVLFLATIRSNFAANEVGDPNSSVVDVMQSNRSIDVDSGDRFWLTVPVGSGLPGVEVHREGDRGWTWLKAGEFLPVQYDQPGEYTIRFRTARARVLAPFTVRIFAPPAELAEAKGQGGVVVLASSSTGPKFSLGSVYAGLYESGATNKFPLRIVSQGAGDCVVWKYGGGWSRTYTFTGPGETSDVVDMPAGQTWTLVKGSGGTHTLSTNSPSKLKVADLILTNDLGHAPVPGSVTNLTWYVLTNEVVTLQVMPGPAWVTNNPAASASLFDWTTNSVALPATTNLTQTFTPAVGSNLVNVTCHSPNTSPISQSTTIVSTNSPGFTNCPPNIIAFAAPGECSVPVEFVLPLGFVECPGSAVMSAPESGAEFPVGTTSVAVTMSNPCGYPLDCTFEVLVMSLPLNLQGHSEPAPGVPGGDGRIYVNGTDITWGSISLCGQNVEACMEDNPTPVISLGPMQDKDTITWEQCVDGVIQSFSAEYLVHPNPITATFTASPDLTNIGTATITATWRDQNVNPDERDDDVVKTATIVIQPRVPEYGQCVFDAELESTVLMISAAAGVSAMTENMFAPVPVDAINDWLACVIRYIGVRELFRVCCCGARWDCVGATGVDCPPIPDNTCVYPIQSEDQVANWPAYQSALEAVSAFAAQILKLFGKAL